MHELNLSIRIRPTATRSPNGDEIHRAELIGPDGDPLVRVYGIGYLDAFRECTAQAPAAIRIIEARHAEAQTPEKF